MFFAGIASTPGFATPVAQQTIPLLISSPGNHLVGPFSAGSIIDIRGTLYSPAPDIDAGETGEIEPLVIQVLNGNQPFATLLTDPKYGQPIPPVTFSVTQNGQMLNAFISGMDIGPKGLAFDEQANLVVSVNPNPNAPKFNPTASAVTASASLGTISAAVSFLATFLPAAYITKNPAVATNLARAEAVLAGAGSFVGGLANDPIDSNYTVVASPVQTPLSSVGLTSNPNAPGLDSAISNLVQRGLDIISLSQAIQTSLNRAQGAFVAGDSFWVQQQLNALNAYSQQLGLAISQLPTALDELDRQLVATGLSPIILSSLQALTFEQNLLSGGLSADELSVLEALGFDPTMIQDIISSLAVQDPAALAGVYPTFFDNSLFASDLLTFANDLEGTTSSIPEPSAFSILILALSLFGIVALREKNFLKTNRKTNHSAFQIEDVFPA